MLKTDLKSGQSCRSGQTVTNSGSETSPTAVRQPKTLCLLGASFGTDNRGVSALAAGTINAAIQANPDNRVFLLDYGYEPTTTVIRSTIGPCEIDLVNIRFSKRILLRNNVAHLIAVALLKRLLPNDYWEQRILPKYPELKSLYEADTVLSIAGGDSFSDIYGFGRLVYVALPQILAILLAKDLVLLPQTIGPFRRSVSRRIASFIMQRSTVVYGRETDSIQVARTLVRTDCQKKLRFSPDMAFALEPFIDSDRMTAVLGQTVPDRPIVGFNISGLLYMGG
ncbi:MAG: polysaccharide pyruvyl transferase family protein [Opitutaceae bacterium]